MLIRKNPDLTYADVTPRSVYLNRRKFLSGLGTAGLAAAAGQRLLAMVYPTGSVSAAAKLTTVKSQFGTTEKMNTLDEVSHYNNFYEFGVDKDQPAKNAQRFVTSPWTLSVSGEVATPRKFSMDEILKLAPLE